MPRCLLEAAELDDYSIFQSLFNVVDWGSRHLGFVLSRAIVSGHSRLIQDVRHKGASLNEPAAAGESYTGGIYPYVVLEFSLAAAVHVKDVELVIDLIISGARVDVNHDKMAWPFTTDDMRTAL